MKKIPHEQQGPLCESFIPFIGTLSRQRLNPPTRWRCVSCRTRFRALPCLSDLPVVFYQSYLYLVLFYAVCRRNSASVAHDSVSYTHLTLPTNREV